MLLCSVFFDFLLYNSKEFLSYFLRDTAIVHGHTFYIIIALSHIIENTQNLIELPKYNRKERTKNHSKYYKYNIEKLQH